MDYTHSPESVQYMNQPVVEVDVFDELLGLLADSPSPDKSEEFFNSIRGVFSDAEAMQDIQRISEMAMTLGAMACMHPHLESFANEMGERALSKHSDNDGHDHKSTETESRHDSKKCSNCKNGKRCTNR